MADVELFLSTRDPVIARVIASQCYRWPSTATEHPIWGLVRIILAQQLSTTLACQLADRVRAAYPMLVNPTSTLVVDVATLRTFGIPERRAACCAAVVRYCDEILSNVAKGSTWERALTGIKGIGPWTIAVFRIMLLREPDVLPLGDVGLERAIRNVYGRRRNVQRLAENWRPFRSVACWYLWRTLGNQQLG